jgi:hypothetical protein
MRASSPNGSIHARVSGERLATALRSAHAYWAAGEPVRAARSFAAEADVFGFVIGGNENEAQRSGGRIVSFLDALGDVRDVARSKIWTRRCPRSSRRSWPAASRGVPAVKPLTTSPACGSSPSSRQRASSLTLL